MFRRKIISIALVLAIILSIVVPGCGKKPTEIEPVSIENLSEFDGEPGHFYLQEASVDISFKIEYSGRFSATDLFSMTNEQDEKVDFRVKRDGDKQAILESPKDGYEKGATYILTLGERAHFTDESLKDARTLTFRIVRDKIEKYEYKESVIETDTISEIDEQTIDVKNIDVQVGDVITGENQNHEIVAYKIDKIADDGTAKISTPALEEIYSDLQFTGEYDWNVDEIIGNPDIKVQIADNFRKSGLYAGLIRAAYPKIDPAQKKNDLEIEVDLKKGSSENSIKAEVSVTIKPSEEKLSQIVKQVAGPSLKITYIQEISLKSKVNFTGILHGDVSVAAKSTSSWKIAVIVSDEWKAQINTEEDDQSKAPQLVKSIITKLNEMPKSVHKEELELFGWKIMVPSLPGLTFDAKFFFYLDCDLSAEASMGQTTNTYCIAGLKINNTQIKPYKKTTETNKDFTISIIGHINVKTGIGLSASAALFGDVLKVTAKLKFGIYFDMFSVSQVKNFDDISGLIDDHLYFEPGISFKIEIEAKAKLLFVEIKFAKELVKKDIPIKELTLGHKKIPLSLNILDDSVVLNEGMVIPPFIEFEYYDVKKGLVLAETLNTDQLTYHILDGETEKKLKVSQDSIIVPEEYSDPELAIIARYDEDDAGLKTQFTVMPPSSTGPSIETTKDDDKDLYLALVWDENGRYGYINEKGDYVIAPELSVARDFAENGLAPAGAKGDGVESGLQWGYIDTTGNFVIEPQFEEAEEFAENGLAAVLFSETNLWGYINEKGDLVVEPQFLFASNFTENGLAAVSVRDTDAKRDLYGYINEEGEFVIEPQYSGARDFTENGLAVVKVREDDGEDYLYGYINEKGEFAIEPQFSAAKDFAGNGIAAVEIIGWDNWNGAYSSSQGNFLYMERWGYINEKGEYVIEPQVCDTEGFAENGLSRVQVLNSAMAHIYGYINEKGDYVIQPQYRIAQDFAWNGLAIVENPQNYKFGYINEKGDYVIEPQFEMAEDFSENGLAVVTILDDEARYQCGYINEQGEFVIEPHFLNARAFQRVS